MVRAVSKYILLVTVSFIIISLNSIFAQGGPPLLLDDTGTPGAGKWEINLAAAAEYSAVYDEWQVPLIEFNYGLGDRGELSAGFPYVVEQEKGSSHRSGFDGVELGAKYRFLDRGASGSSFSCAPQVFIPFESEDESELFLPLEWHQEGSSFGLTAEVGRVWVRGKSEGWEGGVAAAVFLKRVELLSEWHTAAREAPFDLREPMMNVGLIWEWSEKVSIPISLGKSLHSHEKEPNLWSYVGVQFLF